MSDMQKKVGINLTTETRRTQSLLLCQGRKLCVLSASVVNIILAKFISYEY